MRTSQFPWHYSIVLVLLAIPGTKGSQGSYPLSPEVKRQWLFHCGGWGPGCMKTAVAKVRARAFPHLIFNKAYRQSHSTADGIFEPSFILTSGSSWGAIGKRSWIPEQRESARQLLLYVLLSKTGFMYKEMLYREMVRRYLQERARNRQYADVPQLS